jgi:hypothetical protein
MNPRGTTAKKAAGVVIHLPSRGDAGSCRHPAPGRVPDYRQRSAKLHVPRVVVLVAIIAAGVFLMFGVALGVFVVWLVLVALLLATIVIVDTAQESWKAARQGRLALERHATAMGRFAGWSSPT